MANVVERKLEMKTRYRIMVLKFEKIEFKEKMVYAHADTIEEVNKIIKRIKKNFSQIKGGNFQYYVELVTCGEWEKLKEIEK